MGKFLLLVSLIPLGLSYGAYWFFYLRVVRSKGGEAVSLTAREVAERLLKWGGASDVEVREKRLPFLSLGKGHLVLHQDVAASRKARDVASAALATGMVLLARREERVVSWRTKAVKFGWVFPAFVALILVFAILVKVIHLTTGLGLLAFSLAFSCLSLWLTLHVEKAAAQLVAQHLEESTLMTRRSEGELTANICRASVWKGVLPGVLSRFLKA